MKPHHFEKLEPICPRCRWADQTVAGLHIGRVDNETADGIVFGALHCPRMACRQEYPIIDGAPILVPDVRSWVSAHAWDLFARGDLPHDTRSHLGDCLEAGGPFNVSRHQHSIYAWDHYGAHDPAPPAGESDHAAPAGVTRLLDRALDLLDTMPPLPDGPILDLGCSVGGSTFRLAERYPNRLILGADLGFGFIRTARSVLTTGEIRYELRDTGLVYNPRAHPVRTTGGERVDFWVVDAQSPPFSDQSLALVTALNLLDCLTSPSQGIRAADAMLARGGRFVVASPYDWSTYATAVEAWIGGHSQRSADQGRPEDRLRALLPRIAGGLTLAHEDDVDWTLRLHRRSHMHYTSHLMVLNAT